MELDITEFFNSARPEYYSASVAELGNDAGRITWENAIDCEFVLLKTDEEREAFRNFVRQFGDWSDGEIAAWSDEELNALCVQFVSGDMREADLHSGMTSEDWADYQKRCEEGVYSGRIFGGPLCIAEFGNRVFFSLD